MLYNYWLVRYVPDSLRPDTAGIGVIVAGENLGDNAYRFVQTVSEIPSLGANTQDAMQILHELEYQVSVFISDDSLPLGTHKDLRTLIERERRQNYGVVQIDAPGQIVDSSAHEAADALYQKLIFRETSSKTNRVSALRNEARQFYLNENFEQLRERTLVRPFVEVRHAREHMDLAVVDGDVREVSSTFSFRGRADSNLENRVQAWTYSMSKLRKAGGSLTHAKVKDVEIPANVPILALVDDPVTPKQRQIYDRLTADWRDYQIEVLKPNHLEGHACRLNQQLAFSA
ncbi:hypothetical protein ACIP5Z_02320 [Rothia terrae]|uniref:hypothetical protein n=1 Tax=Rothia terrae TaxID=396015 RepID=UPI003801AB21